MSLSALRRVLSSLTMNMNMIYSAARYYDIAFGWRDVPAECEFMLGRYQQARGRAAASTLEVACGPGQHARTFAARGLHSIGLDASKAMLEYAKSQPGGNDPDVSWVLGDMRDFTLDDPVDLACCLMDSLSHLLTLDDLLANLDAVARNTTPGGLYILEQSHPRDAFPHAEPALEREWEMEDESGEITVYATWGEPGDPFDFTTQVGLLTVTIRAEREGEVIFHQQEIIPSRLWLAGEMEAAIRASEGWRLRERFGAMDSRVPWQSKPPAWRMVSVLESNM
ncbi:MAG: class I SAM-dependent methyltransferase [Chloroflexota bacterium]|nr:class I SAM-dependent methyltransferase [Chloroflexota bacterium]